MVARRMTPAHLLPSVWRSLGGSRVPRCPRSTLLGAAGAGPDRRLSSRCAHRLRGGSDRGNQHGRPEAGAESSPWPRPSLPLWPHVPVPVGRPHLSRSSGGLCVKIPAPPFVSLAPPAASCRYPSPGASQSRRPVVMSSAPPAQTHGPPPSSLLHAPPREQGEPRSGGPLRKTQLSFSYPGI